MTVWFQLMDIQDNRGTVLEPGGLFFRKVCTLVYILLCAFGLGLLWAIGPLVFHFLIKWIKSAVLESAQLGASMFENRRLSGDKT